MSTQLAAFLLTPGPSPDSTPSLRRYTNLRRAPGQSWLTKPSPEDATSASPELSDSESVGDLCASEIPVGQPKFLPPGLEIPPSLLRDMGTDSTSRHGPEIVRTTSGLSEFGLTTAPLETPTFKTFKSPKTSVESLPSAIWDPMAMFSESSSSLDSLASVTASQTSLEKELGELTMPPLLRRHTCSHANPMALNSTTLESRLGLLTATSTDSSAASRQTLAAHKPPQLARVTSQPVPEVASLMADLCLADTDRLPGAVSRSHLPRFSLAHPLNSAFQDLYPGALNHQRIGAARGFDADLRDARFHPPASTCTVEPSQSLNSVTSSFPSLSTGVAPTPLGTPATQLRAHGFTAAARFGLQQASASLAWHPSMALQGLRNPAPSYQRTLEIPRHPTFQSKNHTVASSQNRRSANGSAFCRIGSVEPRTGKPMTATPANYYEGVGLGRQMIVRDMELHRSLYDLYRTGTIKPGFSQFNPRTFTTMSWNIDLDQPTSSLIMAGQAQDALRGKAFQRERILDQLQQIDADFLSLQRMTLQDFTTHFEPRLAQSGYAGVYQHPAQGHTGRGLAIFYRPEQFDLVESYAIRYNEAMFNARRIHSHSAYGMPAAHSALGHGSHPFPGMYSAPPMAYPHYQSTSGQTNGKDIATRFKPFANIALIAVFSNRQTKSRLRVVNTDFADHKAFPDIQLLQGAILVDHLTYQHESKLSTVICGDFHALPKSDVVRYLLAGRVSRNVFGRFDYGKYSAYPLKHPLRLRNAYHQSALPLTQIKDDVLATSPTDAELSQPRSSSLSETLPVGAHLAADSHHPDLGSNVSDYLLYTTPTLRMLAFYDAFQGAAVDQAVLSTGPMLPSRHLPLVALFEEKPNLTLPL
ncbi:hypothetical protein H4R35_003750 [Dimargaris xerosporica]|nr:hypothetical protein H4R35_003750 [Dimargaris xerosporica]